MSDIRLGLFEGLTFGLTIENGDFQKDEGLETAVAISLFSDRRVTDEELPHLAESKRGWWGDMFSDIDKDLIGSKIWTLARSKRTVEVLRRTEDYAKQALQWMIEDGIASNVTAAASFEGDVSQGKWKLEVGITRPTGREFKYNILWEEQKLFRG